MIASNLASPAPAPAPDPASPPATPLGGYLTHTADTLLAKLQQSTPAVARAGFAQQSDLQTVIKTPAVPMVMFILTLVAQAQLIPNATSCGDAEINSPSPESLVS